MEEREAKARDDYEIQMQKAESDRLKILEDAENDIEKKVWSDLFGSLVL